MIVLLHFRGINKRFDQPLWSPQQEAPAAGIDPLERFIKKGVAVLFTCWGIAQWYRHGRDHHQHRPLVMHTSYLLSASGSQRSWPDGHRLHRRDGRGPMSPRGCSSRQTTVTNWSELDQVLYTFDGMYTLSKLNFPSACFPTSLSWPNLSLSIAEVLEKFSLL